MTFKVCDTIYCKAGADSNVSGYGVVVGLNSMSEQWFKVRIKTCTMWRADWELELMNDPMAAYTYEQR